MSSSHTHSFWELFYLTKGSCSILIRDALYEINEGTIFLIPCDISHKTIYSNTDNERIVIELGDDYVAPIISGFPDLTFYNKYCCHFFTFNLSASNLINYYFDTVLLESKKHSSISSLTIRHSIQGIILCIIRSGFDITASLNVRNSLQTENTIIQNAIDYIEQNFSANISLTALAEHLHLNPSYLSKLFKDETFRMIPRSVLYTSSLFTEGWHFKYSIYSSKSDTVIWSRYSSRISLRSILEKSRKTPCNGQRFVLLLLSITHASLCPFVLWRVEGSLQPSDTAADHGVRRQNKFWR